MVLAQKDSGVFIFIGILFCSRISAMFSLVGSIIGLCCAYAWGVSIEEAMMGLWGYNSVLASMAIGGIFYSLNWTR